LKRNPTKQLSLERFGSGSSHDSAFFWRNRNFEPIVEKDAEFVRIEESVFERAITTQPEMLDGMGIRRLFIGAVSFVKAEQLALPIVKWSFASGVCA